MPRINERYREFKIPGLSDREYQRHAQAREQLKTHWNNLNRSNFRDIQARNALVDMADPLSSPAAANSAITALRFINTLAQRDVLVNPLTYLSNSDCEIVREMVLHHMATFKGVPYALTNSFIYSRDERVRDTFLAIRDGNYRPNPEWLSAVERTTQNLIIEIAARLLAQYPKSAPAGQKLQESALVTIAMIHNRQVYDKIRGMIVLGSAELAQRIASDRAAYKGREYAYHFAREECMTSIAEHGLSALYSPRGCEQPEMICFNDSFYAGVEYGRLEFAGYYSRDYLLRIPFEPPLVRAMRFETEELCDATADYALHKPDTVPPEKIEIVDPNIATRAIPLIA